MEFEFTSTLPAEYREDLDLLMFFNPQQRAARTGILHSIENYGQPTIGVEGEHLQVTVGTMADVQALFALSCAEEGCELAGLVVYVRTNTQNMLVLHIAVAEAYSSSGQYADSMLVTRLLTAVRESACRLKGLRTITIAYPGVSPMKAA